MSLKAKRELLFRVWSRYADADKHEKTAILNGFVAATGYRRKYAIALLNAGVVDVPPNERTRRPKYGEDVRLALLTVWNIANQICGKRLVAFLPEMVGSLERFGHLSLSEETRTALLTLSASTIDRMVSDERKKSPKGHSLTKPGGLLKQSIKVRTFSDWKEMEPGFFEADLVAHCGDRVDGTFTNTLVLTDIATAWTEFAPLLRRSYADLRAGLDAIRMVLPMPLVGLDTDNGAEFINHDLFKYCDTEKITFTRSRPYRKNDQAHVEQKNGNIIRRIVGYDRYEGETSWRYLLQLYRSLRLYINFFQPSMKLIQKCRDRSKVSKQYDKAQTPYERVLKSSKVPTPTKEKLTVVFRELDPVALLTEIRRCQDQLAKLIPTVEMLDGTEPLSTVEARDEEVKASIRWPRKKYLLTKKRGARHWRTRQDPFEEVREEILLAFRLEPNIEAKGLLAQLQIHHPGMFKGNEVRTLRRRLAEMRKASCERRIPNLERTPHTVTGVVRN